MSTSKDAACVTYIVEIDVSAVAAYAEKLSSIKHLSPLEHLWDVGSCVTNVNQ